MSNWQCGGSPIQHIPIASVLLDVLAAMVFTARDWFAGMRT
jgi:hypothetical protein